MGALIKAGKIRYYGLSNESAWGVCEFRRVARELGVPGPVTLQNSYSLVSRGVDNDLAETLFRESMSLLAYSPLAGGMLTGKYVGGARPPNARYTLFDDLGNRFRKPIVHEAVAAYVDLARRLGITPTQLALGYVKSRWFLGSSIIGATSMTQLAEDIAAAQFTLPRRGAGGNCRHPRALSTTRPVEHGRRLHRETPRMITIDELRSVPLFATLPDDEAATLAARLADVRLRAGRLAAARRRAAVVLHADRRRARGAQVGARRRTGVSTSTAPAPTSASCRCCSARRRSRACARSSRRASRSSTRATSRCCSRSARRSRPSSRAR